MRQPIPRKRRLQTSQYNNEYPKFNIYNRIEDKNIYMKKIILFDKSSFLTNFSL